MQSPRAAGLVQIFVVLDWISFLVTAKPVQFTDKNSVPRLNQAVCDSCAKLILKTFSGGLISSYFFPCH